MFLVSFFEASAQVTPDQAADMLLNGARKAYNEKNYPFARDRFKEFLAKFGGHKNAPSARYGLGLTLLEGERDYTAAVAELQQLAGNKALTEYPFVLYYLGQAQRGLGTRELNEARAKPNEAPQRQANAKQRFEEASKQFAAAEVAFTDKGKQPDANAKELPIDLEWAARARCDLAEMQLRTLKLKEAQTNGAVFVKDPVWSKSRYRNLGLYYHGFASFLLKDYLTAGKSLNLLTPFSDPVFGTHARYLLAHTHHLSDEKAEAALHYEGVLNDYVKQKAAAVESLKRPEVQKNPEEKARLESLVKDAPPEHVARAAFYYGVLRYEEGKFGDAQARFADFPKLYATSPLLNEALLRLGFCYVQNKQFKEAIDTLTPLVQKEPRLSDQGLYWIGKAQVGLADPTNAAAYAQAVGAGIQTLRTAVERAGQMAGNDPEAKVRRAEMLLELADTQQLAKQFKEAAATYGQLFNEKTLPQREEEILQRQVTALHLAGDYGLSDQVIAQFAKTFPKSSLLPAVLYRHAENAYFQALAADKNPNLPNRSQELTKLNDEIIKRYKDVVEKYPDFPLANQARYSLALAYYRKGDIDTARKTLEAIPQPERNGELAVVSYLLADCLIRQAPAKADDALSAGKLKEQLESAVGLLDAFLGAQPTAPQSPDALIKLGYCHQRLAMLAAQPPERAKILGSARAAYEKLAQQFPNSPQQPQAVFERAKSIGLAGDPGSIQAAINELQRFNNDPLKNAPIAPMALLHVATLLRGQNKSADAANILAACRQQHEQNLLRDPARAEWVPLLQYHHGVALREAGKLAEARGVFDQVVKQSPARTEAAEAALRLGQCLKDEGAMKIEAARKQEALVRAKPAPGPTPQDFAAVKQMYDAGYKDFRDAGAYLEGHINQLKEKQPTWEVRSRMLYDAAWAYRAVGDQERAEAQAKMQQELHAKLQAEAAKKTPAGATPPVIPVPEVPLVKVPVQPAEKKARELYQTLMTNFSDLPLAIDARFELAELLVGRGEYEAAAKLLNEALEKEPSLELADKIRIRLGESMLAKGDLKEALAQFETVANNAKSPQCGLGHYHAAEALMQQKEYQKAVAHLALFRDQPQFQNLPQVTDRALLRLGHALAELKQWDQSRQALENLAGRFPNSPWVHEARYGIGWAWQSHQNPNYDQAVAAYTQVTGGTATELGAKAQLQIGLCRLAQKRYPEATTALLVVPFTYDYPELSAVALCEAARTFTELKQPDQARKLFERVIKDHPKSKWAEVARERLEKLN